MNTWIEDQCMYAMTLEKGSHNLIPFNNTYRTVLPRLYLNRLVHYNWEVYVRDSLANDYNICKNQIIELTHYLNVTYGHVRTNRMVINKLNIQVATLNKTMMAVIGETKFIKFTVAALTDMRMTLAQLSLGLMSLQENVNAIYEYMRVLSTRRVNPLIIPPDSL